MSLLHSIVHFLFFPTLLILFIPLFSPRSYIFSLTFLWFCPVSPSSFFIFASQLPSQSASYFPLFPIRYLELFITLVFLYFIVLLNLFPILSGFIASLFLCLVSSMFSVPWFIFFSVLSKLLHLLVPLYFCFYDLCSCVSPYFRMLLQLKKNSLLSSLHTLSTNSTALAPSSSNVPIFSFLSCKSVHSFL